VHHPAEFYAANMTIEMDNTDKLKVLLNDAKLFNIAFEPPDVNRGRYRFEPVTDKLVRYGLGAVKGTGQGAIEAIVEAREAEGAFRSFFDFCSRVDRKRVNKRVVEALIKAGAFDAMSTDRPSLLASVGLAFEWADTQVVHASQGGLFDDLGDAHGSSTQEPPLVVGDAWGVRERLSHEKTALGFYLSGHLFDENEPEVRRFCKRRIADLVDSRDPQLLCGIVNDLRFVNGQRGRVAIFKLDDKSESIEAVANDELIEANKDLLKEDELLIVQGKVQPDRFSGGLRLNVNAVYSLAAARARFGRYLQVTLGSVLDGEVRPLAELLRTWPPRREATEQGDLVQGLPVRLSVRRPTACAELDLGDEGRVWPCVEALQRWPALAAGGQAAIIYEAS
jgi:DNA polymerase III subunit alpha